MIPLIFGGIAVGSWLYGSVKGAQGISKFRKASRMAKEAEKRHQDALGRLKHKKDEVIEHAEGYATYVLEVRETTFERMIHFLEQLEKKAELRSIEVPKSVGISLNRMEEYKQGMFQAASGLQSVVAGAGSGAAFGGSALAIATLFGTASTGTAISSLSGAAATNATLAWFGGGALAAGGGGMALGTLVLGGVVAGPAIAVTGIVLAGKGAKALTKAIEYESQVRVHIQKVSAIQDFLGRVMVRIEELRSLVSDLDQRTKEVLDRLESCVFDINSDEHIGALAMALQLTKAMSEIMNVRILSDKGDLSEASYTVQIKYEELRG